MRKTSAEGCGGDTSGAAPNNTYGWGRVDALAAGNNKALRVFTLSQPLSTGAVRVVVNAGREHYSRVVEVEAYGPQGQ